VKRTLRRGLHHASVTCALSALSIPAALAQTAPAASGANAPAPELQSLSTVVVTGTHILQSSAGDAQPIQSISASQILQSGYTNVSTVLQNIPQAGASLTSEAQSDSSNGDATTINLRYLGANRTLVLINGQRWTPQLNGTVNLTAIPASMIEHVDVLQDGASAIYGSDAIAGVVNIIMRQDFNGAEAHAYYGAYDDPGETPDGRTQEYDFTMGKSDEHSGIMFAAEFQQNGSVTAQNRYESQPGPFTQTTYLPGFDPATLTIQNPALANQTIGSGTCSKTGSCQLQVASGPNYNPTLGNFAAQAFNTAYEPSQFLIHKPDENQSFYLSTHYRLAQSVNFTMLGAYNIEDSLGQISSAYNAGSGGAYQVNGAGFGIGANNPYNPFGVDLVGNPALYCPDGKTLGGVPVGSCTPNYQLTQFGETLPPVYDRISRDHIDTTTVRLGLNGAFNAIGSKWNWEVGYNYGKTYDTAQDTGFTNNERLSEQLDSPGGLQCNGPGQATPGTSGTWDQINGKYYQILIPGCVPVNPFGGFNSVTGESAITPAMAAWSQAVENFITSVTMRDFTGDITGKLINLPGGPLAVAAGAESLQNQGSEIPGNLLQQCLTTLRCIQPTTGRTWTYAEYLELNIPLLKDLPFARSLSLDLANRWSQFRWQGGTPGTPEAGLKNGTSASTGRVQLRWQPIEDLVLRGSWAQGFRAPSISDLYNSGGASYNILQDPCAPASQGGDWVSGTPLPAGCGGVVHSQNGTRIQTATGGNPLLTPEKAISRSAGFTYSPHWIDDLSFGADYYMIDLTNEIGTVPAQYILNECYVKESPQNCNLITLTAGSVTLIENIEQNIGGENTSGVDVNANYGFRSDSFGNFGLNTTWTFVRTFIENLPSATTASGFHTVQELSYAANHVPKIRGNVGLAWSKGDMSATWNVTYIGKIFENCSALTTQLGECSLPGTVYPPTGSKGEHELPRVIYNDATFTYNFEPIRTTATVGVQNVFNQSFPIEYTAGAPPNLDGEMGYRIPGRYIYARVGVKF
jgi:iron complex outermembrane receptor protein